MSQRILTYVSPDEYLRLERQAEYKSEYLNGEIFAMSGASREHNLLTVNIARELSQQLRGRPCEAYTSDMRVKISFIPLGVTATSSLNPPTNDRRGYSVGFVVFGRALVPTA